MPTAKKRLFYLECSCGAVWIKHEAVKRVRVGLRHAPCKLLTLFIDLETGFWGCGFQASCRPSLLL